MLRGFHDVQMPYGLRRGGFVPYQQNHKQYNVLHAYQARYVNEGAIATSGMVPYASRTSS